MNLHQLEILVAVARHNSFTRAARELYLTQPAVSAQIKQLEQSLGMRLLDRTGKKVLLTEAGAALTQRAEGILAQVEQAREDMDDFKGLKRGSLHLGASTTPGVYLLPDVIAEFRKRYPAIQLSVSISNTLTIEEKIARNEMDLGFVGGRLSRQELAAQPYLEDELVVIAAKSHKLAKKREVSFREIRREAFVAREAGSATWQCVDAWLLRQREKLNVTLRLNSPEAVKRAVAAGLGISIASRYSVSWEIQVGRLAVLKVKEFPVKRQLRIIHHKSRKRSEAGTAFVALAKEMRKGASVRPENPRVKRKR